MCSYFSELSQIDHRRYLPALAGIICLLAASAPADDRVRDVLKTYCVGCHNSVDREGGVSLLSAVTMRERYDAESLIDLEDIRRSRLLQVLLPDAEMFMPPEGEPQPSSAEREILKHWVLEGAPLLTPVDAPRVPQVAVAHDRSAPLLSSARLSISDVCVGSDNWISRQNVLTSETIWTMQHDAGRVHALSVSSDGRRIAAVCGTPGVDGSALLLAAADGRLIAEFGGHSDAVYAVVINPLGTHLATSGYDRRILVHETESGKVDHVLTGHNGSIFGLSFDATGDILCSASADGTVKVWNVNDGIRLDTMSQPQAEQYRVVVTPDNRRIVAVGADSRLRVWSLVSRQVPKINPLLSSVFGHEQPIVCLTVSATGERIATAAEDGTLRAWSTGPLRQLATLPNQHRLVTSVTFLHETRLFVTRIDGSSDVLNVYADPTPTADYSSPAVATPNAPSPPTVFSAITEVESNDTPETAMDVVSPVRVIGTIYRDDTSDQDCFRFVALAGQTLVLEIDASRSGSPLDSVVEILHENGEAVLRTRLQAVRDSWFTFRGKDSSTVDDFRVSYWQEMQLNDFLYAGGEVVRLWHYPRGPDSGFLTYPGFGTRHTWFGTTPTAHALQAPCYIVVPYPPGNEIAPNGLPVFPIFFRNDDDPERERGTDSRLLFTAPQSGHWVARITDARGFHGPKYSYALTIRPPVPGFRVTMNVRKFSPAPQTGQEIQFIADRIDGYRGPIRIDCSGLPAGFGMSAPVVIEQDQLRAFATLFATEHAKQPVQEEVAMVSLVATAEIDGRTVRQDIGGLDELTLSEVGRLRINIDFERGVRSTAGSPLQLRMLPGTTIRAIVTLDRDGADGIVSLDKFDAGRNLPHGVFVDNIGLNGLLLPAGVNRREFFITAAPIVPPMHRPFYLKSDIDGITSLPVQLEVLPKPAGLTEPVAVR